jgi:hypothetical protein
MRFRGSRAAAFLLFAFLFALPAGACSCTGGGFGSCPAPAADLIVVGTVVSREVIPHGPLPPGPALPGDFSNRRAFRVNTDLPSTPPVMRITLRVLERLRGHAGDSVVVQTDTSDCGYPFETGHEYLVFANEFRGNATVTTCSATQPAQMAASTIRQLRSLRDGTALPGIFGIARTRSAQLVTGLTVTARSDGREYRTQTAEDGSYEFWGLPNGGYRLTIEEFEGRTASWSGGAVDHAGVNTWSGNPCPINFEISDRQAVGGVQ